MTITPGLYMLQETVSPPEQKIEILSEGIGATRTGGVKFKAILQEAEAENINRRVYKKEALVDGLKRVDDRIRKGIYFCEMDHPITDKPQRFMTVHLKEASHRILSYEWKGNILEAVCQTTSNSIGRDLGAFILEDGIPVGFSLRATGKTAPSKTNRNITEVVGGMNMVCYDAVANPSHSNALTQKLLESADISNMLKSSSEQISMLAESMGSDIELFTENSDHNIQYDVTRNMVILSTNSMSMRAILEEHIRHEFRASFTNLLG